MNSDNSASGELQLTKGFDLEYNNNNNMIPSMVQLCIYRYLQQPIVYSYKCRKFSQANKPFHLGRYNTRRAASISRILYSIRKGVSSLFLYNILYLIFPSLVFVYIIISLHDVTRYKCIRVFGIYLWQSTSNRI